MPNINLIPIRYHNPTDPYIHITDNEPISDVATQISLVNDAVDINTNILQVAQGTAGDLATRLNVSLNPDGTLITTAVNNTLHDIGSHTDDGTYVRMLLTERTKLSGVASNATNLSFQVSTASNTVSFPNGSTVSIIGSSTIEWRYASGKLSADTIYDPVSHFYNQTPTTVNHQNFTTPAATPYISGTLRVYINGIRIPELPTTTYYPNGFTSTISWHSIGFQETNSSVGTFALNAVILNTDIIYIDFDHAIV